MLTMTPLTCGTASRPSANLRSLERMSTGRPCDCHVTCVCIDEVLVHTSTRVLGGARVKHLEPNMILMDNGYNDQNYHELFTVRKNPPASLLTSPLINTAII